MRKLGERISDFIALPLWYEESRRTHGTMVERLNRPFSLGGTFFLREGPKCHKLLALPSEKGAPFRVARSLQKAVR